MSTETSARLALKDLSLDDKTVASNKDPKLSVAHAGSFKPPPTTKRRKKVMMRMSKEYVAYMEQHPPSPPSQPVDSKYWMLNDLQDRFIARKKAERDEWERIMKQYKDHGYVDKEFEVTDDEDEDCL